MKINILSMIFFILFSCTLSAVECSTQDLTKSIGYNEIQELDQGNIGWCFAFSLSKIISQKVGLPISGSVALTSCLLDSDTFLI